MITLVKFFKNQRIGDSEGKTYVNSLITRTLGKTGVLDLEKLDTNNLPKEEEFWFVEITREKRAGTSRGVFVLAPLQKVGNTIKGDKEVPDIIHLIPGTYNTERVDNAILIHPDKLWYPEKL